MEPRTVPAVPETATQGTEAEAPLWGWVEASIWTERMVSALVNGVKGGKWADHQRWPNAFFAGRGLFTLQAAWAQARHSR